MKLSITILSLVFLSLNSYSQDIFKLADLASCTQEEVFKNGNLRLAELVPKGILNEAYTEDSEPQELKELTEAIDIFSVNYINKEECIASVLALKTEDQAFDHNRFVCDRLAGAEVTSVSTVFLNNHSFIRSIVNRNDGEREFVLSFAARITNQGMVIESHWNRDDYTEGDYYNFQIRTSKMYDLIRLSNGILELIDSKVPLHIYSNSNHPEVFISKATREDGKLLLDVINNNSSTQITLDGNMRRTETSRKEYISETFSIEPNSNLIEVELGSMFDFDFKITPDIESASDKFFLSEGPWSVDATTNGTEVLAYSVVQSLEEEITTDSYVVERGVEMTVRMSDYVSAIRTLTQRKAAINLEQYSTFLFEAYGEGTMEVALIKASATESEEHLYASVVLEEELRLHTIPMESFRTKNGEEATSDDITQIEFTWTSAAGNVVVMDVKVGEIQFSTEHISANNEIAETTEQMDVYPNPFVDSSVVKFNSTKATTANLTVVNAIGAIIKEDAMSVDIGQNEYRLSVDGLAGGQYYLVMTMESGERLTKELVKLN